LKKAILALLGNRDKALKMGMKGREHVLKNFSDKSMTDNILAMAEKEL